MMSWDRLPREDQCLVPQTIEIVGGEERWRCQQNANQMNNQVAVYSQTVGL